MKYNKIKNITANKMLNKIKCSKKIFFRKLILKITILRKVYTKKVTTNLI